MSGGTVMTRRGSEADDGATEGGAAPRRERTGADHPNRRLAWAELLRLPALFTVPGDALAGAAATASAPDPRTLLAIGSSLCLYEAGMALNDWADREEDAAERPHRPLPSGRIHPAAALTTACALTGVGLTLAARAGRPALAVAAPLAATVWAYDLALKHTPAGPLAMAAARGLDLLLGAAATAGRTRDALGPAALLATHTLAVTTVSRQETRGGSPLAPVAALAVTGLLTRLLTRRPLHPSRDGRETAARVLPGTHADGFATATVRHRRSGRGSVESDAAVRGVLGALAVPGGADRVPAASPATEQPVPGIPAVPGITDAPATVPAWRRLAAQVVVGACEVASTLPGAPAVRRASGLASGVGPRSRSAYGSAQQPTAVALRLALAAAYAATAARPYFHAALNPSPPLTQRAVTGGIRATIPLQAALTARSGAGTTALLVAALAPLGGRFGRKVSLT
ncbi:SCO3242 family prenyltransferase [Streptomyces sp. NPDC049541]|uniref:SCO3242 family prenyltransferase n=1 Tax=Streptomyces sp. NPDC049541 TaxID=3365594 RepID=UPI0037935535